jgi:hypothetical protein
MSFDAQQWPCTTDQWLWSISELTTTDLFSCEAKPCVPLKVWNACPSVHHVQSNSGLPCLHLDVLQCTTCTNDQWQWSTPELTTTKCPFLMWGQTMSQISMSGMPVSVFQECPYLSSMCNSGLSQFHLVILRCKTMITCQWPMTMVHIWIDHNQVPSSYVPNLNVWNARITSELITTKCPLLTFQISMSGMPVSVLHVQLRLVTIPLSHPSM